MGKDIYIKFLLENIHCQILPFNLECKIPYTIPSYFICLLLKLSYGFLKESVGSMYGC